jgi:hypothetical protein
MFQHSTKTHSNQNATFRFHQRGDQLWFRLSSVDGTVHRGRVRSRQLLARYSPEGGTVKFVGSAHSKSTSSFMTFLSMYSLHLASDESQSKHQYTGLCPVQSRAHDVFERPISLASIGKIHRGCPTRPEGRTKRTKTPRQLVTVAHELKHPAS